MKSNNAIYRHNIDNKEKAACQIFLTPKNTENRTVLQLSLIHQHELVEASCNVCGPTLQKPQIGTALCLMYPDFPATKQKTRKAC